MVSLALVIACVQAHASVHALDASITAATTTFQERHHIPGLAVGVVRDGRTVFARGFGVRRVGTDTGPDECRFVAGFNSGFYQETDLVDWMQNVPRALVTDNLGIPEDTVHRFTRSAPFAAG